MREYSLERLARWSFLPLTFAAAALPAQSGAWTQTRNTATNSGSVSGDWSATLRLRFPGAIRGISVGATFIVVGTELSEESPSKPRYAGTVVAVDRATGRELWRDTLPGWVHNDAVLQGGKVYATFGAIPIDRPGGLRCYDAATGRILWRYDVDASLMPGPAMDANGKTILIAGSDATLHFVDARQGKRTAIGWLLGGDGMSSPKLDTAGIAFLGADARLLAFDTRTQRRLWATDFSGDGLYALGDMLVAIGDSTVYTAGTRNIGVRTAFGERTGMGTFLGEFITAWRQQYTGLMAQWFRDQWLVAVDKYSGKVRWKAFLGSGSPVLRNQSGSPTLAGNLVVVSSPISRQLQAFDAATGQVRWRVALPVQHRGPVTVHQGVAIIADTRGQLRVFDVATGAARGSCRIGGTMSVFQPIVVGKTLLAGTQEGSVFAAPFDTVTRRLTLGGESACFGPT
jgi:outer membrane protein assembly factor BamB